MEPESKNVIPMLSSTPPPMDGPSFDDDEDADFGNFTSAGFGEVDSPQSDMHFTPVDDDRFNFFQTAPPAVDHSTSEDTFANFQSSSDFADFTNANTKSSIDFLPSFSTDSTNLQQNRKSNSIDSNESVDKEKSTDESRSGSQMSTDPDFSSDRKTFNSDSNSFSSPDTLSLQSPSDTNPTLGEKRQDDGPISPEGNLSTSQEDDFGDFRTSEGLPQTNEQGDMENDESADDGNSWKGFEKGMDTGNNGSESMGCDSSQDQPSDTYEDLSSGTTPRFGDFTPFHSVSDTQGSHDHPRETGSKASNSDPENASPDVATDLHKSGSLDDQEHPERDAVDLDDDCDDLEFGKFNEETSAADTSDLVFREPMSNDYGFSAFSEPYDFPDSGSRDSDSDKFKESLENSDAKSDSQESDQYGELGKSRVTDENPNDAADESSRKDSGDNLSGDVTAGNASDELAKDDANNDDFGDFGTFEKPASKAEDDFSDFGTFDKPSGNSGEDFGAFQDRTEPDDDEFGEFSDSTKAKSNSDDFGAFSDSKTVLKDDSFGTFQEPEASASESGGFADFSQNDTEFGQFSTPAPSTSTTTTEALGSNKIQRVFSLCFPQVNSAIAPDLIIELLIDCVGKEKKKETSANAKSNRHKSVKKEEQDLNVWNNLKDVDNTNALTYQWGGSCNDKTMLKSLGIDTRNILMAKKPTSTVPIFAANLTMLQPSKVGGKTDKPDKDESKEENSKDVLPQEPLAQVEFDWSGSGLINPLDAYDDELLGLEIEPPPMPAGKPQPGKPFADILAKMNTNTSMVKKRGQRDANLSDEACKILDSLPNLDFMHAKVLMFPIKPSSSSSSLTSA
ncbi:aftiphilin-like isoform X2 [Ptychodera flava]|uniref:aftiphilin-like isoform X2 n=1 Tax=Ptychodera flava TaxID=63121 RepID=UPI00396A8BA6